MRDLLISRTVASQHGHERKIDHQGAIQQFFESGKSRPATKERERNVKQTMQQAHNLQAAGAKSPQRLTIIVRGFS